MLYTIAALPFLLGAVAAVFLMARQAHARTRPFEPPPARRTVDRGARTPQPIPQRSPPVAALTPVRPTAASAVAGRLGASLTAARSSAMVAETRSRLRDAGDRAFARWPYIVPPSTPNRPARLLLLLGGIALLLGGALAAETHNRGPVQSRDSHTTVAGAAAPASAKSAAPVPTATAAALQTDTGAPLTGRGVLDSWAARGLTTTAADDQVVCTNPGAAPRAYRIARTGGNEQHAFLLVYASPAGLSADWAVERGSPLTYRKGVCAPGAVIYWNQNAVLIFPQVTDSLAKQEIADGFLTTRQ